MAPPKGNKFWMARSKHGRDRIFESPDALWDACCEYFEWVEDNPLYEDKLVTFQGEASHEPVARMRAMTIGGLCLFLGIHRGTWNEWRKVNDFSEVITQAEEVIYAQKFAGAAADLLNANIISRELGLKDASAHEHTSPDGSMSPQDNSLAVIEALKRKHTEDDDAE